MFLAKIISLLSLHSSTDIFIFISKERFLSAVDKKTQTITEYKHKTFLNCSYCFVIILIDSRQLSDFDGILFHGPNRKFDKTK